MIFKCACNINQVVGLRLLSSENCLLCFLELLQLCAYYARFYVTPQSIMLLIIHSLRYIYIIKAHLFMNLQLPLETYSINSDLPHASGIRVFNKIIIINFRGA